MTVQEAFIYVKDRLNKLNTTTGKSISKRLFVDTYNKMVLHWFTMRVKSDNLNQDRQEELQQFIKEVCVAPSKAPKGDALYINMPEDYFYYQRVYGSNCGSCNGTVYGYPYPEADVNRLLQDAFYKPSLVWEETFFTIRDNKVYFYVDDFSCPELTLVYYRCPKEIDMEGITHLEKDGTDIDPELSKASLQEVLDLVVLMITSDLNDPRYQAMLGHIQNFN